MSSERDFFGRGGLLAAVALLAYLLFLSGLLIGPAVPVLILLAAAGVAATVAHLKNPEATRRWFSRFVRRDPVRRGAARRPRDRAVPLVARHRDMSLAMPTASGTEAERGLPAGSPLLRLPLIRGWRSPREMARDFVLLGLAGVALLLTGVALPDWPVLSWIGRVLSVVGALCILVGSGVVYSYWRSRA
ncbi:hypothetical protein [Rhodovulum euryhalinum]|nr:hypothetical protein [Rhodovulum euryhalinum]